MRGFQMRVEVRLAGPVLIKNEQGGIRVRLMQIVINAARFRSRGRQQSLQHLPNARFLARFGADTSDHRKRFVHAHPRLLETFLVKLNQLEDVAVHHKGKNSQQKDQANLNEPFFYGDAQIAAKSSFDRQH